MNKTTSEENGEVKRTINKQDAPTYSYENSFASYYPNSTSPSVASQPLPGQPPLPPMPPPPGALPPLPHVFPAMPQVSQIQSWAHPPWQWIAPQATALAPQTPRDITSTSTRGNYTRRDRFNHNRNNVYPQRGNFHRKNRRPRFDQPHAFDPTAYFGQTLTGGISIDWQRTGFPATQADALNHMSIAIANQAASGTNVEKQEGDQDIKIVSEVGVKKTKQRKPMSQNYPSRPWNLEDAQSALKVENEYNKTVRAQSLIIKFPDPDLNKDIVREFHSGIQNIHFQSPSGPRYCFIQMAEDVNIDEAIKELEKIPFGVGHLKVEKKSLRDEDYPSPEEIDPYTLYVGNLPESVNVNEVKSKFPTASRVDVGYAQKMRNTRYAFIRYTSVEESIAAYKKAHDLMWDTRSIIVRFRRQRGNTCLPGESKNNAKKVKEEPNDANVKKEVAATCNGDQKSNQENNKNDDEEQKIQSMPVNRTENSSALANDSRFNVENPPTSVKSTETSQQPQQQPWTSPSPQLPSAAEGSPAPPINNTEETVMITTIKEEPEDYDEMEMSYMPMDDDDDDDDEPDELDESNDEIDDNDNEADEGDDQEGSIDSNVQNRRNDERNSDTPDHLDQMFNELENIVGDIEL
ncbi:uncharacterized protein Pof [Chelonus insularis]|uniref:uncharacterized protein Pof n=1 Tax=Chelonus insularis TaxID=460826 RepID=UPI00158A65B9|nr:uncharacterized protein LOC118068856 [Chelonus insularis]